MTSISVQQMFTGFFLQTLVAMFLLLLTPGVCATLKSRAVLNEIELGKIMNDRNPNPAS